MIECLIPLFFELCSEGTERTVSALNYFNRVLHSPKIIASILTYFQPNAFPTSLTTNWANNSILNRMCRQKNRYRPAKLGYLTI